LDQQAVTADGKVNVLGASCISMALKKLGAVQAGLDHRPGMINVLLMHYPAWVTSLSATYDLILSGHSHGGQVRLPFIGPLVVPFGVDQYDLGWFKTAAGKMYVGPGIGWFHLPIRFNCRPEITVIEI
jgi:predicted MPP superfamily phosphohydrolase